MSWFSQILENWISFPYLEEYLTSVVHPLWLLKLLILLYSPMVAFILFLWPFSFLLHIYKKMNNQQKSDSKFWEKPRKLVALVSDIVGKIWFDYEVIGMEHLPKGPGVIVYYHAVTAIDYSLLVAKLFKETQRQCYSVIDHAIYQLPASRHPQQAGTMATKDCTSAFKVKVIKLLWEFRIETYKTQQQVLEINQDLQELRERDLPEEKEQDLQKEDLVKEGTRELQEKVLTEKKAQDDEWLYELSDGKKENLKNKDGSQESIMQELQERQNTHEKNGQQRRKEDWGGGDRGGWFLKQVRKGVG